MWLCSVTTYTTVRGLPAAGTAAATSGSAKIAPSTGTAQSRLKAPERTEAGVSTDSLAFHPVRAVSPWNVSTSAGDLDGADQAGVQASIVTATSQIRNDRTSRRAPFYNKVWAFLIPYIVH